MSIYSKIRDLLINDITLQSLLLVTEMNKKVYFHFPKGTTIEENVPCITYYFIETPEIWKDAQSSKDGMFFIDIWSKDNLNDIYERVLELLADVPFSADLIQAIDVFENDTQIYHKHINIKVLGG